MLRSVEDFDARVFGIVGGYWRKIEKGFIIRSRLPTHSFFFILYSHKRQSNTLK